MRTRTQTQHVTKNNRPAAGVVVLFDLAGYHKSFGYFVRLFGRILQRLIRKVLVLPVCVFLLLCSLFFFLPFDPLSMQIAQRAKQKQQTCGWGQTWRTACLNIYKHF
jgi:uncharacterized protein involved in cysteine biosynthesis